MHQKTELQIYAKQKLTDLKGGKDKSTINYETSTLLFQQLTEHIR